MKKILFLFSTLFFVVRFSSAQAPQGINYQGVARNAAGQAMGMQALGVRYTVLQAGSSVYVETHTVSTDTFGLYNAVIGQGSAQQGTFSTINWALGNYAVQVEIDPGTGYQNVGTVSLMSVPYSLYTQQAANTAAIQNQAVSAALPQAGDVLQYNAGTWAPAAPPASGVTSVTGTPPLTVLNSTTSPVITIPQANTSTDGFLAQADWNLFNNKFNSITVPLNSGLLPAGVHSNAVSLSADTAKPFWNAGYILGNQVAGIPLVNDVLRFNGTQWVPGTVGGLPAPSSGAILFTDPITNTWQATNPSFVSSDGNSITAVNTTTVGTAGTFITNNNTASGVPALKAQSNSSTGYALWADNTAGAAILATSPGPYALTGDISFGGGNAVVGRLQNSSSGNAILGSVDGTSVGTAGYFINLNPANDSITLMSFTNSKGPALLSATQGLGDAAVFVADNPASGGNAVVASSNGAGRAIYGVNTGTGYAGAFTINNTANDSAAVVAVTDGKGPAVHGGSLGNGPAGKFEIWNAASTAPAISVSTIGGGPSAIFAGGTGLETDAIRITGPLPPTLGAVLTSDAAGNASWQPASATLPAGTNGQMLYNSSGTWIPTNTTSLTFTGTNLGIGQATPIVPLDIASTHTVTSMNAVNTGTGSAGRFFINNAASAADAVTATTNGAASSKGVSGKHSGAAGGYGVFGEAMGSGGAAGVYGYASNVSGTNNYGVAGFNQNPGSGYGVFGQGLYGVYGQNISSAGYGVYGVASTGGSTAVGGLANQTSGKAGDFQVTNTSNPSNALTAGTAGTGSAGTFSVTASTNTSAALIAGTIGMGPAIVSNGRLIVANDANPKAYVQGSSTSVPTMLVMRSNGSLATPSAPVAGMTLGMIGFSGHDGTAFNGSMLAGMRASAAQVYSASATGTDLYFQTTPIGSSIATDRMIIDRDGSVGIGTTAPGALLDVASSTASLTLRATNTSSVAATVAYFNNTSSTNNAAVLVSLTNGTGPAGDFKNANSANAQNTLSSTTNGSGSALIATNTGAGRAAFFEINSVSANSSDALYAATFGTGRGAWIEVNNAGSTADALHATTNGTGAAVNAVNNGGGVGVRAFITGNSNAGYFQVNNSTNNNPALYTATNGMGPALMAQAGINGFSGVFTGGNGMKTDGFTAMLKMHPGGALTLAGTDCFLIIPGGVSGSVALPAPSAVNTGKVYVIKNLQAAAFPSTSFMNASGISVSSIPAQTTIRLISDGVNWQEW